MVIGERARCTFKASMAENLKLHSFRVGSAALKYRTKMASFSFCFSGYHHTVVLKNVIYSRQLLNNLCCIFPWRIENTLTTYRNQPSQDLPHRSILASFW